MGYVYFFKHNNAKPIKIGATMNNPEKRLKAFLTYAPYGGECLGYIECENPFDLEKELHVKFKEDRLYGEWFDLEYLDHILPLLKDRKTRIIDPLYRWFEFDFPYRNFEYKKHSKDFLRFTKYFFEKILFDEQYNMSDIYNQEFMDAIGLQNKFHFDRENFIKKYCKLFDFELEHTYYCDKFTIKF